MNALDLARKYIAAGYSIVAIPPDGSKRPGYFDAREQKYCPARWGVNKEHPERNRQATISDEAELKRMFPPGHKWGIGLVQGKVSGNAEMLDFDATDIYDAYIRLCDDHGIGEIARRPVRVKTPSGGDHLYYRLPEPPDGNTKLAMRASPPVDPHGRSETEMKREGFRLDVHGNWVKVETLIETRGEGGQALAPGSPVECHPDHKGYILQSGRFTAVPIITMEERNALFAMACACNEWVEPTAFHSKPQSKGRTADATENRPGDDYNAHATDADVLEILTRNGWREVGRRGDVIDIARPGKSEGISGTINHCAPGVFFCFSSSASPFDIKKAYPPFSVYTLLEHGGDFKEAAYQLGRKGYGDQTKDYMRGVSPENLMQQIKGRQAGNQSPDPQTTPPVAAEKPIGEAATEETAQEGIPVAGRGGFTPYAIAVILRGLPGYEWDVSSPDSEAAHAYRIALHLRGELCYCSELGFMIWNGRYWERDDKENTGASARVAPLSAKIRAEAIFLLEASGALAKEGRSEDAEALARAAAAHLRHAKQTEKLSFILNSLSLAANALRVPRSEFDPKPWRLGFANGVWDCGLFREHRREDYFLSVSPVVYSPDTNRSEWETLLSRMTGGDLGLSRTLQEMAGYIVSGASHLRLLPWFYGPKGTGKSTIAELLKTMLGSEAVAVEAKDFSKEVPRERLGAKIWGKRLIVSSEAGEERLSAETLKQVSGGDTMPVRHLFKEQFDARPRHVLLMVSNDPPSMNAYDDALKDRVKVLPLVHPLMEPQPLKLTGGPRIESVRENPAGPLVQGFVAWVVDGLCAVYRSQSVYLAPAVESANTKFWKDTDQLTGFWETVPEQRSTDENGSVLANLGDGIPKSDLRRRYETWCEGEGVRRPLAPRQWTKACEAQGLEEIRSADKERTRCWQLKQSLFADKTDKTDSISVKSPHKEDSSYREDWETPSVLSVLSANNAEVLNVDDDLDTYLAEFFEEPAPPVLKEDGGEL